MPKTGCCYCTVRVWPTQDDALTQCESDRFESYRVESDRFTIHPSDTVYSMCLTDSRFCHHTQCEYDQYRMLLLHCVSLTDLSLTDTGKASANKIKILILFKWFNKRSPKAKHSSDHSSCPIYSRRQPPRPYQAVNIVSKGERSSNNGSKVMTVNIATKLGQKSEVTGTDPFTENRLFLN